MPKTDSKSHLAGLTSEEQGLYENAIDFIASAGDDDWEASNHHSSIKAALESLAASRAADARKQKLLEKHQWVWNPHPERGEGQGRYECRECHQEHRMTTAKPLWLAIKQDFFHKPSCALAAELKEGG